MKKVWHILGSMIILLFAAVWFHTAAHIVSCHHGEASDDHDDSCAGSVTCTCVCHTPMAPLEEPIRHVVTCDIAGVAPRDELVHSFLLPSDIFRPPVANS